MIALLHVPMILVTWFGQIGCQHVLIPRNKFKFRTTAETAVFPCSGVSRSLHHGAPVSLPNNNVEDTHARVLIVCFCEVSALWFACV